LNTKEILLRYKIPEDQGQPILEGLKISKKNLTDELSKNQVTPVEQVCLRLQNKLSLDQAIAEVWSESQSEKTALVQHQDTVITFAEPPVSKKVAVTLQEFAEQVIPPDGVSRFLNGALDGVEEFADQLTPSYGKLYGHDIAKKVASTLPNKDEEIQREIDRRLGERKAKGLS
jgi:2-succinyl-5-enolpyruvyl-6-hydroxy-3-cyclohexene-1-carboxylate synthase